MARRKKSEVPGLRRHKPTGKAVVTLSGQDFYCGPWGSKTAMAEYDRLVAEWLARSRRAKESIAEQGGITVVRLCVCYMKHCRGYYRKDGKLTSEVGAVRSAVKVLQQLYGREPVAEFDTLKLQAVQQAMIRLGWARKSINAKIQRIVRMFKWGVAQKLVSVQLLHSLREVEGLHQGRTAARDPDKVRPVEEAAVQATLAHLPQIVADMVRLQRLTGARSGEICQLRPCDVDTSGAVWAYRPESHKTAHLGHERVIFIGPRGQTVLRPYLLRDKSAYCFVPIESEAKRRAAAHRARKTPLHRGNRPGTNKRAKAMRPAGLRYTNVSYRKSIERACEIAFEMPDSLRKAAKDETAEQKVVRLKVAGQWRHKHCWHPHQLRHSAGTEIRGEYGIEGTQVVLGHRHASVAEIYAERDLKKAAEIMLEVG